MNSIISKEEFANRDYTINNENSYPMHDSRMRHYIEVQYFRTMAMFAQRCK